jgi:predicted TIM-barrel fold metal-dependent hydrolase
MLEDFQGAAPSRILGLPLLPVDDGIDACVAELERVLTKGARGAFIPANPVRPYQDPHYDPLYRVAQERGIPLTFHRTFGGKPSEVDWDELVAQKITVSGTAYRFFSGARPFTYMTFGGVFERFPRLKLVAAEVNCSWLPFWAQTMDQCFDNKYYRSTGGVRIERRPSELLGRNLFVTVLDDDLGFRMIGEGFAPELAECSLFSSDYPHSVCLWPNSQQQIARLTKGMRESDKQKVLSGNAERVYGL